MERKLNISKVLSSQKIIFKSTEESLKEICPIKWSKEVENGSKKIQILGVKK